MKKYVYALTTEEESCCGHGFYETEDIISPKDVFKDPDDYHPVFLKKKDALNYIKNEIDVYSRVEFKIKKIELR